MTQPAILAKLAALLNGDITTECQVVYLLAEIRKLIEQEDSQERYYSLDFYCSWALHTSMSHAGAVRILRRFDEAHPTFARGGDQDDLPPDLRREIERTAKLTNFREELKEFLRAHGLPTPLATDMDAWPRFLRLYGEVIHDGTLRIKDESVMLDHLDHISLHLEVAPELVETFYGYQLLFKITWRCHAKDGTVGDHFVIFSHYEYTDSPAVPSDDG